MKSKASLPDQAARRQALLDHDRTLLVEAGAGTGKTSLLAGRIVFLLANGRAPRHIVAITFTEAAAAELLDRINEYATQVLQGKVPDALQEALPAGLSEEQRQQLSLAEQELSDLTCTTIHGFCQQILRPYPVESQLDPNATIIEPAAAELAYADLMKDWLSEIFGRKPTSQSRAYPEVSSKAAALFHEFLKQDRAGTLKHIQDLGDFLKENRRASAAPARASIDDLLQFKHDADAFAAWYQGIGVEEDKTQDYIESLQKAAGLPPNLELPLPIEHLVELFFRPRPSTCKSDSIDFLLYRCKTAWKKLAGRNGETLNTEATNLYARCADSFARRQATVIALACEAFVSQFDDLRERFRIYKQQTALLDFDDLLHHTRQLLLDHPQVRTALAQRYQTILVDEFQDTDPIQAEILWLLCGEGDEQTAWHTRQIRPGSLFLVGDPKQAIYRFRGADIGTYLTAKNALIQSQRDCMINITSNFRSKKPILDFVNQHFASLLSEERNQPGFANLEAIRQNGDSPNIATFPIHLNDTHRNEKGNLIIERLREEEAQIVARLVASLLESHQLTDDKSESKRRLKPGDIALLAPFGTALWIYEQALENYGIPIATQAGKSFFHRQEVHDLIAITRTMADSRDTLALGALIRGPLVGLTEEAIADEMEQLKAADESARLNLWTDVTSIQNVLLRETLEILQQLARRARQTTPYQTLAAAVEELRLRPIVKARWSKQAERGLANVERFLEMAKAYDGRGLQEFALAMRQRWSDQDSEGEGRPDANADAVSIITIHSSKGLEWPVVIPINSTTLLKSKTTTFLRRNDETVHFNLFKNPTPDYEDVRTNDLAEQTLERVRLWYVALTRAADLLLLPNQDERIDNDWFSLMNLDLDSIPNWPLPEKVSYKAPETEVHSNQQDQATWQAQTQNMSEAKRQLKWHQPSHHDNDRLQSDETLILSDGDTETTTGQAQDIQGGPIRGTIMHKLIEEILTQELDQEEQTIINRARTLLEQLDQPDHDDPAKGFSSQEMGQAVHRTLTSPTIAPLVPQLTPELAIFGSNAEEDNLHLTTGIADAVATDAQGHITTVIDWKTDTNPTQKDRENHRTQLAEYLSMTKAKTGMIVYLTMGSTESLRP